MADFKSPLARKEQKKILAQRADALLAEASQLNFTFDEVLDLLRNRQAALNKAVSKESSNAEKCS